MRVKAGFVLISVGRVHILPMRHSEEAERPPHFSGPGRGRVGIRGFILLTGAIDSRHAHFYFDIGDTR